MKLLEAAYRKCDRNIPSEAAVMNEQSGEQHPFDSLRQGQAAGQADREQDGEQPVLDLSTLLNAQRVLTSSLDTAQVLHLIVEQARILTHADAALVALPEDDDLVLAAISSTQPSDLEPGFHLPLRSSICGRAYLTGLPQRSEQTHDDPDRFEIERSLLQAGSIIAVPLKFGDDVTGVLAVTTRYESALDSDDEMLLNLIAPGAAMALENARLYAQAGETAVAAERGRLARDLHDSLTQTLFSASLTADILPRLWQRDPVEGMKRLEKLRDLTRGALAELRSLLLELRPATLTESALGELLSQLAAGISSRTEIEIEVHLCGSGTLPGEVQVAIYRIVQEALNNVARHAGASRAEVVVDFQPAGIMVAVRDDGCGFDFDPGANLGDHYGLRMMGERAAAIGARLTIDAAVGRSTTISVCWLRQGNPLSCEMK